MPTSHPVRPPFSMRHAFALAFDLSVWRDPVHSLLVPFVLRSPWMVALALLFRGDETPRGGRAALIGALALLGQSVTWWTVDAMLRFRARSVFNTARDVKPASALECYARGLGRLPWLYLTEFVRNIALTFAFGFFVLPGVLLSYRLAFSTEAVVLDEPDLGSAFRHSFHLSQGRFERWLEMIAVSVALALAGLFTTVTLYLIFGPSDAWWLWLLVGSLLAAAIWPIIQYAWTFFYLRLIEVETHGDGRDPRAGADPVSAGTKTQGPGPARARGLI
ncbi:MAG: hypothetical protein HYR73_02805 [Candidatus Eisenbacteria bacterium]|nr:hypothetical protein [Candidatus Eisenbacteria bacterium]